MNESHVLPVTSQDDGKRLDLFLAERLPEHSRSFIKKVIEKGLVLVDGKVVQKAGTRLKVESLVAVTIPEPEAPDLVPEGDIDITILYEDDHLAVIQKPAGLVVHPACGHPRGTLVNALLARLSSLSSGGDVLRPGIVHRLDKETSGVMVVAKTDAVHRRLTEQFAAHSISRKYRGIVFGMMKKKSGIVETRIGRHPKHRKKMAVLKDGGRVAITEYRVLEEKGGFSLVEFTLRTGRTHQIRVHVSHLGHPIVGDTLYSTRGRTIRLGKKEIQVNRNMLHAFHIGFVHPVIEEWMEFTVEDPQDFREFWELIG